MNDRKVWHDFAESTRPLSCRNKGQFVNASRDRTSTTQRDFARAAALDRTLRLYSVSPSMPRNRAQTTLSNSGFLAPSTVTARWWPSSRRKVCVITFYPSRR